MKHPSGPWQRYWPKDDPGGRGVGYTPEASDGGRDWPTIIITTSIAAVVIIALVLGAIAMVVAFAWAADAPAGRDPARGAWFKSLKMNQSGNSCCDLSDCQQTQAHQEPDGSWTAIVNSKWRAIPPSVVLSKPLSIDGEAYVCNGSDSSGVPNGANIAGVIYCFIPPVPGF